jgi:hypothetical protein
MTKKSTINPELDKYIKQLLEEVMRKPKAGDDPEKMPSLTDKMKVIDRVLKWEAVKGKLNDGDWGAGFSEEPTED